MALPHLAFALNTETGLDEALSTLFERSTVLTETLVPQLFDDLSSSNAIAPASYSELVDLSLAKISTWTDTLKAGFISSHPRIGEVKGLSKLSSQEQASVKTPPAILARLEHLNALYEARYIGLRYIVFVNGRTRAEIVPLMKQKLGIASSEGEPETSPDIEAVTPLTLADEEWRIELERAVEDVGRIAKSRLKNMGLT